MKSALLLACCAVALSVAAAPTPSPAQQPPAIAPAKPVKVTQAAKPKSGWAELSAEQRQALAPLAGGWPKISEAQKRKWIALSANFGKLSPDEQAKLHSRMTEWVGMSPQQRAQARLNFAETNKLSADDKKAKWEAYQALPAEEKRKLADGAGQAKPPATAAALKPVAPQKLAKIPAGNTQPRPDAKAPRIAAAPAPAEAYPHATPPAMPAPAPAQ